MPKRPTRRSKSDFEKKQEEEFEQRIIDIARVTRVMAGGKRMRFRACVVIGDKKGRVGLATKKGPDVSMAIQKAVTAAKKNLTRVNIEKGTIPHQVLEKYGSARVLIRPVKEGKGIIAGGPVRSVIEVSGIQNVVSKMLGSNNKINNAWATLNALKRLRTKEDFDALRS